MPKKKDKKGGDKPKEDKKTQPKGNAADNNGSDDKEKILYLHQIRYLSEQVERYRLNCDELVRQKKDLSSRYISLEREKGDIVEYLKRAVLEKEEAVDELTERLEDQRRAADEERGDLQLQQGQLRKELQDRIEGLVRENGTLVARLASVEEFEGQRERLVSSVESLEKQLAIQREDHQADIHSLEMKALLEKKRLEQEMKSNVADMAAEVQHLVDQRVPETTKQALQENTEVRARFVQLSEQAQLLMKENSALQGRKSQLSVDVDILEQMLKELSRESCIRKKVVEQLTEKCQLLQEELKVCEQEHRQLQTEHKNVLTELEPLRQRHAAQSERCSKNRAEVALLEAELQEATKGRSQLRSILQEAVVTLKRALMEALADGSSEGDVSIFQWKQLVQRLLVMLDTPALADSPAEKVTERPTPDHAAARPGAPKHIPPRMGPASILPLYRKPSSQKTASSITWTSSGLLTSKKHSVTQNK